MDKVLLYYSLIAVQLTTLLVAIFYYPKVRNSYWKWFCIYLIFICLQEIFWRFVKIDHESFPKIKEIYYAFVGIPIQYLFFYWLIALKSLKNHTLFVSCVVIFYATLILEQFFSQLGKVYSLNLTVGTLLLFFSVILEFRKQVYTDDILHFKKNKMFYVSIGIVLFYLGTYPFMAFIEALHENHKRIFDIYFVYFYGSNILMYLLFIMSFLWGKNHSS